MLRKRFEGTDKNVPWEYDKKEIAYAHVERLGFRVARNKKTSTCAEALAWAEEQFEDYFVVKAGDRHSCIGVYLLKRIAPNQYLELLTLKRYSKETLGKDVPGRAPAYWMAESFVESYIRGRDIPLDYKFYCFGDRVALVVQIDRNCNPTKAAVFDGNFIPLRQAEDYRLDVSRWDYGNHVVPLNAPAMMKMAIDLSVNAKTPFVRIDLYDSASGPVFGEYTFADGPVDVGMLSFNDRITGLIDDYLETSTEESLSGFDVDSSKFWGECRNRPEKPLVDSDVFQYQAAAMLNGHRKCSTFFRFDTDSIGKHFEFVNTLIGFRAGDMETAFSLCTKIRSGAGFFNGVDNYQGLERALLDYYDKRRDTNDWSKVRYEQVKVNFLNGSISEALEVISPVADAGYGYAVKVRDYYLAMNSDV